MTLKIEYKIIYELGNVEIPETPWHKFPKTRKEFVWKLIKHTTGTRYHYSYEYGIDEIDIDTIEVLMESESKLLLEIHLKNLLENSL